MGQYADDLINGDFDCLTGEYIGEGDGFPRTMDREHAKATGAQFVGNKNIHWKDHNPEKFTKSTKAIRKELAILIKKTIKENPEKNESVIVNECRAAMNTKYGKGWREQYMSK